VGFQITGKGFAKEQWDSGTVRKKWWQHKTDRVPTLWLTNFRTLPGPQKRFSRTLS